MRLFSWDGGLTLATVNLVLVASVIVQFAVPLRALEAAFAVLLGLGQLLLQITDLIFQGAYLGFLMLAVVVVIPGRNVERIIFVLVRHVKGVLIRLNIMGKRVKNTLSTVFAVQGFTSPHAGLAG